MFPETVSHSFGIGDMLQESIKRTMFFAGEPCELRRNMR
jgi:hypothetical protein